MFWIDWCFQVTVTQKLPLNPMCPWCGEIRVVAFNLFSAVTTTGTNHSALSASVGQLHMFFWRGASSNSKKPVVYFQNIFTSPSWQKLSWLSLIWPNGTALHLSSFMLFRFLSSKIFPQKRRSSGGWRQLALDAAAKHDVSPKHHPPRGAGIKGWKVPSYHTQPQGGLAGALDRAKEGSHIRRSGGSPQGPAVAAAAHAHTHTGQIHAHRGTTIIHLLEKAGDVVFAAGRPRERVGVGRDVGGHQFGGLVAFGATGIPNPIVVHPETGRHNMRCAIKRPGGYADHQ